MLDNCSITGIDAHAHVFSRTLTLAGERRYTPGYDATLADYLGDLHANGLSHGVLVQPSFLGTDNRYLLSALQQAPDRLRGVVVVERDIPRDALHAMARSGVVGVRLNLVGRALPDFTEPGWKVFFEHIVELDWHVELHRELDDLPHLVRQLLPFGVKLVIDHFGRPDARLGVEQRGFTELLALGLGGQLWLKVSGIYRLAGSPAQNLEFAHRAMPLLQQSFGLHRLVWGSDWPHTQHEASIGYGAVIEQRQALGWSAAVAQALLIDTPRQLFGFHHA
ncbi:amidohydrolase family protein [Pseudomonas reactans]|uniref:Amidohydrolase family protein n=1 Tax=Pseudomonas reactans TaxID=117680 RepID=A0ABX2QZM6_9PSED|nr:amidohydrolase family protein [Pseudomonas reactans]NWA41377.1 amidohydrolase family protein [Pseudomonas reactans]NWD96795.1 amidohydrolase family protein [Pseudomonas reactans]